MQPGTEGARGELGSREDPRAIVRLACVRETGWSLVLCSERLARMGPPIFAEYKDTQLCESILVSRSDNQRHV
jgi:hypothetical protein